MLRLGQLIKVLFALGIMMAASGCSSGRNTIFIVDTSGSMRQDELITRVKQSIRKILESARSGDAIYLYTFDVRPRLILSAKIEGHADIERLTRSVDAIEAHGPWTDLLEALDQSLNTTVELLKAEPGRKTVLVLYTDGQDDPPPGEKRGRKLDFNELFRKYYAGQNGAGTPSWFIYYVELDKPSPELRQFLEKTGTGKIISRIDFLRELDVTLPWLVREGRARGGAVGAALVALFFILLALRGRALRRAMLLPISPGGDRASLPLVYGLQGFFQLSVVLGSQGNVLIMGTGVEARHARIRVDLLGQLWIKRIAGGVLRVDGATVSGKAKLTPGQRIQIGPHEYILSNR